MKTALKIRLHPTLEQRQKLAVQFGCVRWAWNNALSHAQTLYQETGQTISTYDLKARFPQLKDEFPWLKEADSQALQQSILNLGKARDNFFSQRTGFPKFKNKGSKQAIQYPQRVKFSTDSRTLYLPKVGWVTCVLHRDVVGKIKTVTVSQTPTGQYYAALTLETGELAPEKPLVIEIIEAVDLNIYDLTVNSKGVKTTNPRALKRAEKNLRTKQKKFSRKQKGSHNREKAQKNVAKVHEKVKRVRHDVQHKLSFQLSSENQAVVVEDLHVKGMLKNHKLAKALSDAAFSSFISKLSYKLERRGGYLVKVGRFFPSSKMCSSCDYVMEHLALSMREWYCPNCTAHHDRDINAAKNLLREGIRILTAAGLTVVACGGLYKTPQGATVCEAGSFLREEEEDVTERTYW